MTELDNDREKDSQSEGPLAPLPKRYTRFHEIQDDIPPESVSRNTPERQAKALALVKECARIGEENRAENIQVLDLRESTPLFDYFVVMTTPSRRQGNAIISDIDARMKRLEEYKLGIEGSEEGRWTLIDYGDFVIHVLSPDARDYYALEEIWGDAPTIDWRDEEASNGPA